MKSLKTLAAGLGLSLALPTQATISPVVSQQLDEMRARQGVSQQNAQGWWTDASLQGHFRSYYMNRNYVDHAANDNVNHLKHPNGYAEEWGGSGRLWFQSGFTPGKVGFGTDLYLTSAYKLDTGRGREGLSDFPTHKAHHHPSRHYGMLGGALKARVSKTRLTYGTQTPTFPVMAADDGRLLSQTWRGTLLSIQEISGVDLHAGHYTAHSAMNQSAYDYRQLKALDVYGTHLTPDKDFSADLFYANTRDVYRKHYAGFNYSHDLEHHQRLGANFVLYRVKYARSFTKSDDHQHTTIWSLKPQYQIGNHTFATAYQRVTGDRGYEYDYGDGGSTDFYANSYYSDYNAKDQRSQSLDYTYDLNGLGIPGLTENIVYVRGWNVDRSFYKAGDGRGRSHELYNNLVYKVPEGPARDLYLRLRTSIYRSNFDKDLSEARLYVEYPYSFF